MHRQGELNGAHVRLEIVDERRQGRNEQADGHLAEGDHQRQSRDTAERIDPEIGFLHG